MSSFPDQPASFNNPPPSGGWFSRNWWWFVPGVIVLPMCLCFGGCGGLFMIGVGAIKSSEPYQTALKSVQDSPKVKEQLGEPITASFMLQGSVNVQNSEGDASLDFDVSGPKGTAHVHTEAERTNNQWTTTELRVSVAGGAEIDLLVPDNQVLPEAKE